MTSEELVRVEQLKRAEMYLMNAVETLKNNGYDVGDIKQALNLRNDQDYEDYLSWLEEGDY